MFDEEKTPQARLIAEKKRQALEIISAVGIPLPEQPRRRERMALALLAVVNVKPETPWKDAAVFGDSRNWKIATREMINYWNQHYGEQLSLGSYDDVRRQDLILLVEAGMVLRSAGNPSADRNDPQRRYALSPEAGEVVREYGTKDWADAVSRFISELGNLRERLSRERHLTKIPVCLPDGKRLELSPGGHNELQKAIIEEFLPRFAPGAEVLYLGDTADKFLHVAQERLSELGLAEISREELPDVIAYDRRRNWLFLVEAVHSANPISELRHLALRRLIEKCTARPVYVSVFRDRASLKQWVTDLSWETEVWLADSPDHMIHFDGERFLGPYEG
jgi:type II restriction enzyme